MIPINARYLALLGLLAALFFAGCTTQDTIDQQTEDINRHTTEVVEKENRPITKIRVLSVSASMRCIGYDEHDNAVKVGQGLEARIERDHQMQEFDDGRTIVLDGITEIEESICPQLEQDVRNMSSEVVKIGEDLMVESVKYNKTVYQEGRPVASNVEDCRLYHDYDTQNRRFEPEVPVERLYSECFGIEDAMKVIGSEE